MFKNMNSNKGNKCNKRHLFCKLCIYDKIGKKRQHKIVAFQSQWQISYRFTFYFKADSLHLKRHFAKVPGSGIIIIIIIIKIGKNRGYLKQIVNPQLFWTCLSGHLISQTLTSDDALPLFPISLSPPFYQFLSLVTLTQSLVMSNHLYCVFAYTFTIFWLTRTSMSGETSWSVWY